MSAGGFFEPAEFTMITKDVGHEPHRTDIHTITAVDTRTIFIYIGLFFRLRNCRDTNNKISTITAAIIMR